MAGKDLPKKSKKKAPKLPPKKKRQMKRGQGDVGGDHEYR